MVGVFMVSDYALLIASLAALTRGPTSPVRWLGFADRLAENPHPWGEPVPDVLLIDTDGNRGECLAWLKSHPRGKPRVLTLARKAEPGVVDELMSAGASGVIDGQCTEAGFWKAIEKVAQGEIWLDRHSTGRLWARLSNQERAHAEQDALTAREREILCLIARHCGEPTRALADRLHISESTLRNHLTSIYEKCGVPNRAGLVAHALKNGFG
ncbi:MAG: hypothetical protein RIR70_1149 [Pseudomonadota bacterium]|jgi:DNA-binding NarL/FixJ family response regulator